MTTAQGRPRADLDGDIDGTQTLAREEVPIPRAIFLPQVRTLGAHACEYRVAANG
ncbi:hypothetical protein SNOG_15647 [Parastagonospora nodorum SN15]|uniref:Uncharacterized protein n=1 Tax=Phaeosphaeria nodorum (strain SN15 / ATCC MYA-4574 / FGSC 10173) TaxID=321614 RepID=Q0TY13_PHANO|nr:hypothetical protein SNOG_15647 [Parastagonospora nodorum SN15]EAT77022.1 hypothetical protein SNOG_15647 [Parastagonospora nodorum SN15]